jgi:DNA repair protein RecN (Recombination protein N)
MLTRLYIRDYAIIDELDVEFGSGLNIITGETGAGKSILIDAFGLLIGERASSQSVRKGARKGVVEGFFAVSDESPIRELLRSEGYDDLDELIIRREVSATSGSRAFVNDSPAQLALLTSIGGLLVDLHGQHDHQQLLKREHHLAMLDEYAGLGQLRELYATEYRSMKATGDELRELRTRESELLKGLEFLRFQAEEIDAVHPEPGEHERILQDLRIAENHEDLFRTLHELTDTLYDDADSVATRLQQSIDFLEKLASIDDSFEDNLSDVRSAVVLVEEVAKSLRTYGGDVEFSPEELETLRERLLALNGLRKKYGGTIESVLQQREEIERQIDLAANYDSRLHEIEAQYERQRERVGEVGGELSELRRERAKALASDVEDALQDLELKDARFEVSLHQATVDADAANAVPVRGERVEPRSDGLDIVEFLLSTNPGEDVKPLKRIASGGEISRVMLALKGVLATSDHTPVLIFDEIDTGISGRVASRVADRMVDLARHHQILTITHLPQIAAASRQHYRVEKVKVDGRVATRIRQLTVDEQAEEVARLVSGEEVTDNSMKAARELMASRD